MSIKRPINSLLIIVIILAMISLVSCGSDTGETTGETIGKTAGETTAEIAAEIAGEIAGEISVSYFSEMPYGSFLAEAADLFEHDHPGAKINLEGFSYMPEIKTSEMEDGSTLAVLEDDDEAAVMDYSNRVNTALMSGKGPDILAFDVLPFRKYADSGILEDLAAYMEADEGFNIGDYRRNILDGARYKSSQYMLPLDFFYFFIALDNTRVDGATAAALKEKGRFTYWELTDAISGQFMGDSSGARVIDFQSGALRGFRTVFNSEYKNYIDLENKKAHFTDSDFAELLKRFERQRADGYFVPEFASRDEITEDYIASARLYYLKYETDMVLQQIFLPKQGMDVQEAFPTPTVDEIAGLLVNSEGKASFRYSQAYGISANSQNKQLAWEFLKFLMGGEMQQSNNLYGLPINNEAFTKESKKYFVTDFPSDGRMEITKPEFIDAYNEYIKYLDGFVSDLSCCPITDTVIDDLVSNEAGLFFDGSTSAEEAAATLQNRVQLYLDE